MPCPALIMQPDTTPGMIAGPAGGTLRLGRANRLIQIVYMLFVQIIWGAAMARQALTPSIQNDRRGAEPSPTSSQRLGASQKRLAERLNIPRWAAVIGGSLGGMQALQWAVDFPDWVEHCIALAAAPGLTAQNIAFNEIARHAICRTRIGATAIILLRESYPPGGGAGEDGRAPHLHVGRWHE